MNACILKADRQAYIACNGQWRVLSTIMGCAQARADHEVDRYVGQQLPIVLRFLVLVSHGWRVFMQTMIRSPQHTPPFMARDRGMSVYLLKLIPEADSHLCPLQHMPNTGGRTAVAQYASACHGMPRHAYGAQ